MDVATLVRSITVFLIFAVTLALNLEDNLVARLGMAENYGLMAVMAIVFTLFVLGRNMFFVATIVVLCLIANMPTDFGLNFGLDRDYYAGLMMAMLFQPFLARALA